MTPSEYLDATKAQIGITSDYALAKRLDISDRVLPAMRRGERHVPLDVAYKIAIVLKLDPAAVVADLESQREKNPQRLDFWRSFLSRAAMVAIVACTLAWNSFATCGEGAAAAVFGRRRQCA